MPNHIEVTVNGNNYNNVREECRSESPEGLPEITVRVRLKMGWEPDIAFTLPAIPPSLRRRGHNKLWL